MEREGAAVVVPDSELDGPRLAREVGALLASSTRLQAMAAAAERVAKPEAARTIAHAALDLAA
jgi:UDP-N-acetylglucosamine--N-acetylmuramyl-(pentapeptide) pyrophosphoryl-undecaprenol N-acetylglucosamine transferase